MQNTTIVKCVVTGQTGVGKSSILIRYSNDEFDQFQQPTLGAAFISKTEQIGERNIKFQIWDTAGQQKYQSLAPIYYRQSEVALLVYDVSDKKSFEALKKWLGLIKQSAPQNIMIVVIGNKTDKIDNEQVSYKQGKQFAEKENAIFKLTSAKEGYGIKQLFISIGQKFYKEREQSVVEDDNNNLQLVNGDSQQQNRNKNKKNCCG